MHARCEKSTWLIFYLMSRTVLAVTEETTTLSEVTKDPKQNITNDIFQTAESAEPKKLDIVKQIRRLNEDGSYTVGYEAGDGTFKIESRDSLGNIKGTFGYIDTDGEIKRVSYSTSNNTITTPVTSTPLPASQLNRYNKTTTTTTRRPLPTVVYPRGSGSPTRATVIQAIPRRRPTVAGSTLTPSVTTTKSYRVVSSNYLPLNRSDVFINSASEKHDKVSKVYSSQTDNQIKKPIETTTNPNETKETEKENQSTKNTETILKVSPNFKPVYESLSEKEIETHKSPSRNTFRRQLTSDGHENLHMVALQQSAGDDTTDVYGGSFITGTVRPLFTTTTGRPRIQPYQSILASRQKLQDAMRNIPAVHENHHENQNDHERVSDNEHVVTSNPIPVIHIPSSRREQVESRLRPQHIGRQYPHITQFRSSEYLRDNPGAPIPIGNQRPIYRYNPPPSTPQETEQFLRDTTIPPNIRGPLPSTTSTTPQPSENVAPAPYTLRNQHQVTRLIPVPVDERGIPINDYHQRYFMPQQQSQISEQSQYPVPPPNQYPYYPENPMGPIATPVSTRDLKRLLHQLIIRQQRLQQLIELREGVGNPGPPYQPIPPPYRPPIQPTYPPDYQNKIPPYEPQGYPAPYGPRPYEGNHIHNPYQYRPAFSIPPTSYPNRQEYLPQPDVYTNQIANYDAPYESQRYSPRRRYYPTQRPYEQSYAGEGSSSHAHDQPEYLPPEVREALLLKMLMLAINPEVSMASELQPEITTLMPEYRKKVGVRNVQILGEDSGSKDDLSDIKRSIHMTVMRANNM